MRFGQSLESPVLRVRVGFDEHFLPSWWHEMRLWRGRESEISWGRKVLRT